MSRSRILPHRPRIKPAMMSADEIREHNEKVQALHQALKDGCSRAYGPTQTVWVATGNRYDPDPRQCVLTWSSALYAELWGVG